MAVEKAPIATESEIITRVNWQIDIDEATRDYYHTYYTEGVGFEQIKAQVTKEGYKLGVDHQNELNKLDCDEARADERKKCADFIQEAYSKMKSRLEYLNIDMSDSYKLAFESLISSIRNNDMIVIDATEKEMEFFKSGQTPGEKP
jgi:hypothetical protein